MSFKVSLDEPEIMFSASHFLKEPTKCSRIHGHNYYVSVEVSGDLNENDFVIDFFELKWTLKGLIDPLDHHILIPEKSTFFSMDRSENSVNIKIKNKEYKFPQSDVCFLPIRATTSELIAKYLHQKLKQEFINYHIKVQIGETKTAYASFEG
jgi:6-pyruvoyltetrahydropterin/6-carboxytetrahydropterin synthase